MVAYEHTPVSVDGKRAVVVGGTSGIGQAIALGFASEGADVVATSRTEDAVDETASISTATRCTSAVRSTRPTTRTRCIARSRTTFSSTRSGKRRNWASICCASTSSRPHPDFVEAADRLGILVWEEPANPDIYTDRSKEEVRDQIRG